MDALDVLLLVAEEGDVVDLVLEQNAGHLVGGELLGLDLRAGGGGGVEVVRLERAAEERELQGGPLVQRLVVGRLGPHQQRVDVHGVFRGGLLVFAVAGFVQPVGPGVAVVPVEGAEGGEVRVRRGGWVGDVADEGVHVLEVGRLGSPRGVKVGEDGASVDEVAVVEVVIVVVGVAKVGAGIAGGVGGRGYNAAPSFCYVVLVHYPSRARPE